MKKDRRQINKRWYFTNKLGETFEFALIGSGKNSYIKTLNGWKKGEKISTEILEQLQHDIITYCDGFPQELIDKLYQIVAEWDKIK